MLRSLLLLTGGLLFQLGELQRVAGVVVEISELQLPDDEVASGEYEGTTFSNRIEFSFTGEDPIDEDCPAAGKCIGLLTRDGSLDLDSRYGCTEPPEPSPDDTRASRETCGVEYTMPDRDTRTISSVRVALHPDSISKLTVLVDGEVAVEEWDAAPGQSELQEIPGLDGFEGSSVTIDGVMEIGDYFAILEVEIYVDVEEVPIAGVSASSRASITATATADEASVMNTLDGDSSDASSWTCSSGEVCVITYDLEAVESLEQLRIAFSESSSAGGTLNVMAAGESGVFSTVREGIEAGGRPVGSDGLQTFGGVRALARYVQIEVLPASGGPVVINEVEFRVGIDAPARPVAESKWLKPTGPLPLVAGDFLNPRAPQFDIRTGTDGGCDSPGAYDGCHAYYLKDGDMDTRWSCGPMAVGTDDNGLDNGCDLNLRLNYYRYLRQIQIAFHLGDEGHEEFSIEAETPQGTVTVVASAISSGDSTDYQTFDLRVFANMIRVVPKYQRVNQFFSIKEMNILELRRNEFIPGAGVVPVYSLQDDFDLDGGNDDEDTSEVDISTRFSFDIPEPTNFIRFRTPSTTVTAIRMRFPANREFTFAVQYSPSSDNFNDDITEEFTSAGGPKTWETFTLSVPGFSRGSVELFAVEGPTFVRFPDYPTLRVVDFEMVGELITDGPGHFEMVTTTMTAWGVIPDIIGDGVSEQEEIMTAICETKGSTYDGADCVGELDDSTVIINMQEGNYFLDGPVFVKSGVTLSGTFNAEGPALTFFILYEGDNNGKTAEEGVIVIDGVTDAEVENVGISRNYEQTGEIVPGTIGNLDMDVKNSQALRFADLNFGGGRTGSARFTDSSNITAFLLDDGGSPETGVYMELTRVDDFSVTAFGTMHGLLMDTCNNIFWEGLDEFEIPDAEISAPAAGSGQTANVVITGDSSNIIIKDCDILSSGAEPRILMESTMPLTLDAIEYDEAVSGDCIVQVDPATTEDLIVQVNAEQNLSKSGDCWLLD